MTSFVLARTHQMDSGVEPLTSFNIRVHPIGSDRNETKHKMGVFQQIALTFKVPI